MGGVAVRAAFLVTPMATLDLKKTLWDCLPFAQGVSVRDFGART